MSKVLEQKQQRLKQKDLVFRVLRMFSEELERIHASSIWDIEISSTQIIGNLKRQCDIDYKTEYWLWTQLKRYEEDTNIKLFTKINTSEGTFAIRLAFPYKDFHQKKHLYISEKLMVANAVFDELVEYGKSVESHQPIRIFLGAGGLCNHIASIFVEHSQELPFSLEVYSHNLGVIEQLSKDIPNLKVLVPGGSVDPTTYTILSDTTSDCADVVFDYIIQGTSFVYKGRLFIESEQEFDRKSAIAHMQCAKRILTLSMHEFIEDESIISRLRSYASLTDYDQLIVPRFSTTKEMQTPCQKAFAAYKDKLEPLVLNWSYEIYQIPHS